MWSFVRDYGNNNFAKITIETLFPHIDFSIQLQVHFEESPSDTVTTTIYNFRLDINVKIICSVQIFLFKLKFG